MRKLFALSCLLSVVAFASCDMRSGTAKREMEKYTSTPEPPRSPLPEPPPIDPADSVAVDTSLEGTTISVDGHEQTKSVKCTKYDRVMVNGDKNVLAVQGACRQIMVNGDGNEINVNAAAEFVMNGTENNVRYARYVNAKRPIVVENQAGNVIDKTTATPERPGQKTAK